ncbi:MAG: CooT family nickel-binding protein [Clostridiales bacterium]|nr:CooT family nickel-binding protein [Clostridiales bacterium]
MCLSTAYANIRSAETVMAKNVTQLGFDGGDIILTDLMGAEVRVTGTLSFVDLVNGVVIISTE